MSWHTIDTKIAEGYTNLPHTRITFYFYASGRVYAEAEYDTGRINTLWNGTPQTLDHYIVYDDVLFDELFWEWED